jgi:cobalt-zinc-cadmium efflux system protein
MLTCHILVEGDDAALAGALLRTIRARIVKDFGIKHMTIQLETTCCHPGAVHCNLNTLTEQHQIPESVHANH